MKTKLFISSLVSSHNSFKVANFILIHSSLLSVYNINKNKLISWVRISV
jgi:hypothetical protein